MKDPTRNTVISTFYCFAKFSDFADLQEPLRDLMLEHDVRGTLLLAAEGINGTIAGAREGIDSLVERLRQDDRFSDLETKESYSDENPFYRTKVKLKKEIVTMGEKNIDPNLIVGSYVNARDWNELISDPDVFLLDTRNRYEVEIGSFENAVNPNTNSFREFPDYVKSNLDPKKHKKVAMYCTGGIRCEKSTAFLKQLGFAEVFHLKGGILKYLEEVPETSSKWQGECFVFDNRVTVKHKLERGNYDQCHACRMPITSADKQNELYQKGVSCLHCYGSHTKEQVKRYAERERQIELARDRGETHIGQPMQATIGSKRREKLSFKALQRKQQKGKL